MIGLCWRIVPRRSESNPEYGLRRDFREVDVRWKLGIMVPGIEASGACTLGVPQATRREW